MKKGVAVFGLVITLVLSIAIVVYGNIMVFRGYAGYCSYPPLQYYSHFFNFEGIFLAAIWCSFFILMLKQKSYSSALAKWIAVLNTVNTLALVLLVVQYPRMLKTAFFFSSDFPISDQSFGLGYNPFIGISVVTALLTVVHNSRFKNVLPNTFQRAIIAVLSISLTFMLAVVAFNINYTMCQG